jgi:hypothetical protein
MGKTVWKSRAKDDLIIEVWEYLDCESVGANEILSIEQAVRERFGDGAIDNPMIIARLLADEGAELRHPEIMELFVKYEQNNPYDAMFRGVLKIDTLKHTLSTIRDLENFRRKFSAEGDKKGLASVREIGLRGKKEAAESAKNENLSPDQHKKNKEISAWFALWLETPELFENWAAIRKRSPEFIENFGDELT